MSPKKGRLFFRNRLKRFQREAQTTACLESPHTVKLYDYGVTEAGAFYYVMELLNGIDVKTLVTKFGPLHPERAVMLLRQACRSIMEAHSVGLIHRDIKPQNLFICKLGLEYDFLKVLDFGIVKYREEENVDLTQAGEFLGSPTCTAPEMILNSHKFDERVDIYSLGCVAYWMVTGRNVFDMPNTLQILMNHISTPPEPPSRIAKFPLPTKLEQIILQCLEKKPEMRIASVQKLWEILGQLDFKNPWTDAAAYLWWQEHLADMSQQTTMIEATKFGKTGLKNLPNISDTENTVTMN